MTLDEARARITEAVEKDRDDVVQRLIDWVSEANEAFEKDELNQELVGNLAEGCTGWVDMDNDVLVNEVLSQLAIDTEEDPEEIAGAIDAFFDEDDEKE